MRVLLIQAIGFTRRTMRLDRFRAWITRKFNLRVSVRDASIALDETGFTILAFGQPYVRIEWARVVSIYAFKRDCWIYDTIRLEFNFDDGMACEIDEDMDGYKAVVDELERRFGVAQECWWSKVALPPFETNLTCLWSRDPQEQSSLEP